MIIVHLCLCWIGRSIHRARVGRLLLLILLIMQDLNDGSTLHLAIVFTAETTLLA
jgi:hypothetical protein